MSNTNQTESLQLKIWQQNLNTSLITQQSILNGTGVKDWNIYALQEPHINFLRSTYAPSCYHVVYPSTHLSQPELTSRAVTLISKTLNTNHWQQIPFPSPDVVVTQFHGPFGRCTLINIY
ncbi:hypothetical protein BU15DRAFT_54923, partial [Melanogaster broomeanus]